MNPPPNGSHAPVDSLLRTQHASVRSILTANSIESSSWKPPSADNVLSTSPHWQILVLGQFISMVCATIWASQATLNFSCALSLPAFSTLWVYILLFLHFVPLYLEGRRIRRSNDQNPELQWFLRIIPIHASPWVFLGAAFVGVEATYLTLLAFRYTTITSVGLTDALALPTVLILSRVFLKRRYYLIHLVGVATCIIGLSVNVATDYISDFTVGADSVDVKAAVQTKSDQDDDWKEYPYKSTGDMIGMLGGILYGAFDVISEECVQHYCDPTEYLGMIGFWGVLISFIQAVIFERSQIMGLFEAGEKGGCSMTGSILLLVLFSVCASGRKILLARFLILSEAALLNLSLLTTDLFTAIFSIVVEKILPLPTFWVGLILTMVGILLYESGPSPIEKEKQLLNVKSPPDMEQNISAHALSLAKESKMT